MQRTIAFYNSEVERYANSNKDKNIKDFINEDATKISWSDPLRNGIEKGRNIKYSRTSNAYSMYRPFQKMSLYFNNAMVERLGQIPQIFPKPGLKNSVICVSGIGARAGFSALITDSIPCYDMIEKGKCFPLKLYEKTDPIKDGLFKEGSTESEYTVKDGISDAGLAHVAAAYPAETITKEDIFYYIYGLLHSEDYRTRFADNLAKQLPRIPCVKTYADFAAFTAAGRALAELHLNYENVAPYPVSYAGNAPCFNTAAPDIFRVTKMKYGKNKDKTTVIYNSHITMTGIPLEAYDYVVNGKPALDWVIDRQCVKTDKASGIINDANDYAIETMNDPAYPLKLFQRVITVSLKTLDIVKNLPEN